MKNLQDFSRYINELVKQKKFENALISFRDSASNFDKGDIAKNDYLVANLLNSYRQNKQIFSAREFIVEYNIEPLKHSKLVLSAYGWLLHECFKEENATSDEIQKYQDGSKCIFPLLDFKNEYDVNLFRFLFLDIIRVEKKKKLIDYNVVFDVLKSINFRNNREVQEIIKTDDYLLPGIIDILRKSGQIKWAEAFFKVLSVNPLEASSHIRNSYGWLLYSKLLIELNETQEEELASIESSMDSFLMEFNESDNLLEQSLVEINKEVIEQVKDAIHYFDKETKYTPFSRLFHLILKIEKSKANPNWQIILDFLNAFDGSSLSLNCDTIEFLRNGKPKKVELASDREVWYSNRIKALYKLSEFEQCIITINKAKVDVTKLHYSNDLWFIWKTGLCKKEEGRIKEAIEDIENVYIKKKEWFVQKELAELYLSQGKEEKALNLGIEGALNYGEKEKKDGLYFLLGKIFQQMGEYELAFKHFLLGRLIRESQGWKVPKKYVDALEQNIFNQFSTIEMQLGSLHSELSNYWKKHCIPKDTFKVSLKSNTADFKNGFIKMVDEVKGFGFIAGDDRTDYYFKTKNFKSSKSELKVNLKVTFQYLMPADGKRGEAINVKKLADITL